MFFNHCFLSSAWVRSPKYFLRSNCSSVKSCFFSSFFFVGGFSDLGTFGFVPVTIFLFILSCSLRALSSTNWNYSNSIRFLVFSFLICILMKVECFWTH